jgi:hypothetical protein
MRYEYASYQSLQAAKATLEDMFATGDVTEGERPLIEKRQSRQYPGITRYVITLPEFN